MMAAAKASSRFMLARGIDVMLQASPALAAPLSLQARADFLVLFTQPGPAGYAISKSRLYDWLMPAYHTKTRSAPFSASTCPTATADSRPRHLL